jgi:hypothetical protein
MAVVPAIFGFDPRYRTRRIRTGGVVQMGANVRTGNMKSLLQLHESAGTRLSPALRSVAFLVVLSSVGRSAG